MIKDLLTKHKQVAEEIVSKRGGKLLNTWRAFKYNQNMTMCKVECAEGHIWDTTIDRLKQNYWCSRCRAKKRMIKNECVKELVESKGGQLLKDEVINNTRYITIKCNIDNNIWTTALNNPKSKNQWCRECYRRKKIRKLDIDEINQFMVKNNLKLLTPQPIDY